MERWVHAALAARGGGARETPWAARDSPDRLCGDAVPPALEKQAQLCVWLLIAGAERTARAVLMLDHDKALACRSRRRLSAAWNNSGACGFETNPSGRKERSNEQERGNERIGYSRLRQAAA